MAPFVGRAYSCFALLVNIDANDLTRMLSVRSHTICRKAKLTLGLRKSCLLLSKALDTTARQQLDTVRHLNIRHVITQRNPSEDTNAERRFSKKTIIDRKPARQATVPHDNKPLDKRTSAALQHHKRLDRVNVNKWRSDLVLPPDVFWKQWKNALNPSDAGGLDTALRFVDRWQDASTKSSFRVRSHEFSNTGSIYECTSHASLALLGVRTTVSYGYSKVHPRLLECHAYWD